MLDEWAYFELSSMGNKLLETPVIDRAVLAGAPSHEHRHHVDVDEQLSQNRYLQHTRDRIAANVVDHRGNEH